MRGPINTPLVPHLLAMWVSHPHRCTTPPCGLPDQPAAVPPSAFIFHRRYGTYSPRQQTSLKVPPPKKPCSPKITPLAQSAALPCMVRAKLVHPVELYVPTNIFFNFLRRVYFSKSGWWLWWHGKEKNESNEKKNLYTFAEPSISTFFIPDICDCRFWFMYCQAQFCSWQLLNSSFCHAELYFRVVPCNLGRRVSSPHDTVGRLLDLKEGQLGHGRLPLALKVLDILRWRKCSMLGYRLLRSFFFFFFGSGARGKGEGLGWVRLGLDGRVKDSLVNGNPPMGGCIQEMG